MSGVTHGEIVRLLKLLPKYEYAFYYNHITRKGISKRLIVAVDNLKEFHKENIKLNKTHYPYTARFFKEKIINFFSKYGARTHFNTFKLENEDNFKYGIIKKQDLLQDLTSWETLLCSSFMMRPISELKTNPEVKLAQYNNLRSATATAAILTKNGESEVEFYQKIVKIPHYKSVSWFQLLEKEDSKRAVEEDLRRFREIYQPIIENDFRDSFKIINGQFEKNECSSVTRYLLSNINDNVHQNLNSISPLKYDEEKKFHKKLMTREELYEKIDDSVTTLSHDELSLKIKRSLDKILLSHRNSAIFLILMSGPFLIGFYAFKYALKILLFYVILKKKPKANKDSKEEGVEKKIQEDKSHN
ncbi:unnamed protein product [Moneuplotes crassus]|uniref:Phosphatidate cytidylyltransferase, mitochondrial n=1 Tax=Euplotes crassus TaxID=5936 RepID=A0AAD1UJF9_EUPCR|nr:unnamed protein product [Moneuplotes crassus]